MSFVLPWISSLFHYILAVCEYYLAWLVSFLDYYVPGWKLVILSPFVICFVILPILVLIYMYICALLLHLYRRRHKIFEGYHDHSMMEGHKKMIAAMWSGHGWIWHGYEVKGMENIPDTGGALIVYYHGAIPIDIYYLNANLYMEKSRTLCSVMDYFAFKIPVTEFVHSPGLYRKIYEKTRLPLRPLYGGFPAKMTTYLGKPIYSDPDTTPEELVVKTRKAIELLIRRHQRRPGSIFLSCVQRFNRTRETQVVRRPQEGLSDISDVSSEGDLTEASPGTSQNFGTPKNGELRIPFLSCQCIECDDLRKGNFKWKNGYSSHSRSTGNGEWGINVKQD